MANGLTIEFKGLKELEKKFGTLDDKMERNIVKELNAGALLVRASAVKSIRRLTGSRVETRYSAQGKPRTVRVSNRGDAPNNDTGMLVRLIRISKAKTARGRAVAKVISGADYSRDLEEGKNRPFMKPALEANEKRIKRRIAKAMGKSL